MNECIGRAACSTTDINLKASITTATGDILEFILYFSEKIRVDTSYESSASQMIFMKCHPYFF